MLNFLGNNNYRSILKFFFLEKPSLQMNLNTEIITSLPNIDKKKLHS
jgi:hypothetical protein